MRLGKSALALFLGCGQGRLQVITHRTLIPWVESKVSTEDIIIWKTSHGEKKTCSICYSDGPNDLVLQVRNPLSSSEYLDLYRCNACASYFYCPRFIPTEEYYSPRLVKHVCETAWGIDSLLAPLISVEKHNSEATLLDVGCGLGLSVDFAIRMLGWNAVGVEPSPLGLVGRSAFNAPIHRDYLENIDSLRGNRFGIVYASEVIEHVDDPVGFIGTLARYVSDRGMLLITTPNAEYLATDTDFAINIILLAPGDHVTLFTPNTLKRVLKDSGFKHVSVLSCDTQIVVCASHHSLTSSELYEGPSSAKRGDYYRRYLDKLAGLNIPTASLANGILYRRVVERIERGDYVEAKECLGVWLQVLCDQYGKEIVNPESAIEITKSKLSLTDFIDCCPSNLAGLHFYLGLLAFRGTKEFESARRHFHAAFQITKHCFTLGFDYFCEDLLRLWDSYYYQGYSFLADGDVNSAIQIFREIRSRQGKSAWEFCFTQPRENTMHQSTYNEGVALMNLGQLEEAIKCFKAVLATEQSLGWNLLTENAALHLGRSTGRIIREGLEQLEPNRHAYGNLRRGFTDQVGSMLSPMRLYKLSASHIRKVVLKEGLSGVTSRLYRTLAQRFQRVSL